MSALSGRTMLAVLLAGAAASASTVPLSAQAQTYPDRPVRVIVPFPAGGVLDSITRSITERMRAALGQPVILENKGGAGGTIGLEACLKSPPDGYTFCAITIEQATSRAFLEPDQWERYRTLAPITQMVRSKGVIYANPALGVSDIDGLVKLAKEKPGKLNYASFGWGSSPHLLFEWLNTQKGVDLYHVPMKSAAEIMNEIVAGRMDVSYVTVGFARPHIETGKVKALAVTGSSRAPLLPNTPSLGELGLDFAYDSGWFALMGPPGVDPAVVKTFVAAIRKVMDDPEYKQKFLDPQGYEAIGNSPDDFARALRVELDKSEALVKIATAKPRPKDP